MRVALVHDWLVAQRGGENVLCELAALFEDAPIFTLVHQPGSVAPQLEAHSIHTSFLQRLPGAPKSFRRYLPLFPAAIEAFDLSGYDLVVSSSHCVAKGVRTAAHQRHVSYVHTPMRYIWDQMPHYLPSRWLGPAARAAVVPLRRWDVKSAARPTRLLTNSQFVARRIERVWHRDATVVYPPVDVDFFDQPDATSTERAGYVVASALVPYKGVELAVRAATKNNWALTVIGDGSEKRRLRALAGPSVTFVGSQSREDLREAFRRARALLFCGEEDFGIIPVEAMASGCPVIALARGGALETVVAGATGAFFDVPTAESLARAVARFEAAGGPHVYRREIMRHHVRRFDAERFRAQILALL